MQLCITRLINVMKSLNGVFLDWWSETTWNSNEFVHFVLHRVSDLNILTFTGCRSTVSVCQPCHVKYDFVGHDETLPHDAEHVLRQLSRLSNRTYHRSPLSRRRCRQSKPKLRRISAEILQQRFDARYLSAAATVQERLRRFRLQIPGNSTPKKKLKILHKFISHENFSVYRRHKTAVFSQIGVTARWRHTHVWPKLCWFDIAGKYSVKAVYYNSSKLHPFWFNLV